MARKITQMTRGQQLRQRLYAMKALTAASMKMYFRNKTGVFFTLFMS